MTTKIESLEAAISAALSEHLVSKTVALGEITLVAGAGEYLHVARTLRDHPDLRFEQLIDLCGVDYYNYGMVPRESQRFAAVSHLLSISNNVRVRLRAFAPDDEMPVLPSLVDIWPSVNWFEREAFDLFGIIFEGHPDLRRILTDYGFIGHPFRRDFPIYGNVEMRYDPDQKRVIYQPVTIAPREIIPRVIREEGYGGIK